MASDLGVATSGFVCGITAESCWQGMTQAQAGHPPLVPRGGAADATTTPLWQALYKGPPAGTMSNNMPQTLAFTFSTSDLAAIRGWIEAGAPDN
jgi:hypothetical protein